MASTKSLFLLAFALSVAVLSVNSSPLAKVDQPSAHSLIAGKREPGDYLEIDAFIMEDVKPLEGYPMVLRREYRVLPSEIITQVIVTDLKANGDGPEMTIYAGGPGSNSVSLLFQTEKYYGINVSIQVYAKHSSESQ